MKINKPYTISESEKNRIRGLHTKVLREDSGREESSHYGKDMGHDDKELYDLKHDDASHVHIDDLEDDIHYDHDHDLGDGKDELEEISVWANDYEDVDDDWREEMGEEMLTDLNGGTYEVAEEREQGMVEPTLIRGGGGPPGGGPIVPPTTSTGINASTIPGGLPKGWKMVTSQEIEEEDYMSDLYEVWLGDEETELVSEGIPNKEQIYELPSRFGNKRMTETELVKMINTIVN